MVQQSQLVMCQIILYKLSKYLTEHTHNEMLMFFGRTENIHPKSIILGFQPNI